ncbi:cation:proton antiporter [Janibacter sp. GXQ6167]|uniref:cation:proton antiporter n=1 Tax=Janibacter sp. GXQ6167 TaxID=3240791 RepID=UPI0035253DBA
MLAAFAVLITVTALLGWVNERFVKAPTTVGVTLAGAIASILVIVADFFGLAPQVRDEMEQMLQTLDFSDFVLNGILSVLLFAGALGLDARSVMRQWRPILLLATVGTMISTVVIGVLSFGIFALVGLAVPLVWALLFGALISPTDPVAVLDLLKRAKVPGRLRDLIAGESLLNDGVGVVLFLALAGVARLAQGEEVDPTAQGVALLFLREAGGGVLLGLVIGVVGWYLTKTIDGYVVELLITFAMVIGGYLLASELGVSGPLAMVLAGLAMSLGKDAFYSETRELVEDFWETLDQILNVLLFAFIGLDVLLTETTWPQVIAGVLLIPVCLLGRLVGVGGPIALVRRSAQLGPGTVRLLTWGGLRGGIAISLALGLPYDAPYRTHVVTATYIVVLFSIAVQGLTVMPAVRRAAAGLPDAGGGEPAEEATLPPSPKTPHA